MLSRDLLERIIKMLSKMPVREDFVEKYLKKLNSEGEIQDYKVLGLSDKMNRFVAEVKFKSDWYRMGIDYAINPITKEERFVNLQLVNHDPNEYTDVFSRNF